MTGRLHQRQIHLSRRKIDNCSCLDSGGRDLGSAHALYKKALKLTPKAEVEEMRKLEAERIADLRQRLWSRLAGRPDPADPTKTIQPTNDELVALVGQVIRLARHEAMVFGLDAPAKMEVAAGLLGASPLDREEIDIRLARLTPQERDTFMMLIAKMDGLAAGLSRLRLRKAASRRPQRPCSRMAREVEHPTHHGG
jgi:hypothetical protein